jgi:hypothetical protein
MNCQRVNLSVAWFLTSKRANPYVIARAIKMAHRCPDSVTRIEGATALLVKSFTAGSLLAGGTFLDEQYATPQGHEATTKAGFASHLACAIASVSQLLFPPRKVGTSCDLSLSTAKEHPCF